MYDILRNARDFVGSKFWTRGAGYFHNQMVDDFILDEEDKEVLSFLGEVQGSYDNYRVIINILKNASRKFSAHCTCPAYAENRACKHIAAFAMAIDEQFYIKDDLNYGMRDEEEDDDVLDYLPKQNSSLNILNKMSFDPHKLDEGNDYSQEDLYKIKLDFSDLQSDIELSLFKSKRLKNGNLSSGKQIYRDDAHLLPQKFKKLTPFIAEQNRGYYWGEPKSKLSFNTAPEFFITSILESENIYSADNKEIKVDREVYDLKLQLLKNNKDYTLSLVLVGNNSLVKAQGYALYGEEGSKYYAFLTADNYLLFFQTKLPKLFFASILQDELVLTRQDFEEFKKSKNFEVLIENLYDINSLGEKTLKIEPKNKLLLDIDNDHSRVRVEYLLNYNEKDIDISQAEKRYFLDFANNIIERDFEKEAQVFSEVMQFFSLFDEKYIQEGYFIKYIDENIDDFFDALEKHIENGLLVEYKQATKRITNKSLGVKLNISSQEDWFDVSMEIKLGDDKLEQASEIILAIKQGKDRITLENGMTILIKDDLKKSIAELSELGIDQKDIGNTDENGKTKSIKISKYNIGLLKSENLKGNIIDYSLDKEILKLKKSLKNFKGIKSNKVSENIKAELRTYQKLGYDWMKFLSSYNFSGILADDMGLGKTIQTLALLQSEYDKKNLNTPSLVICPTSLVLNWIDEAKKFTPNLKADYIKNGKNALDDIKKDTQLIICSYGLAANIVEKTGFNKKFHYLILDEAQNIKNPVAARTKSILKIQSKYRLALTGTPIENNLLELWSIFNFLMPGFLANINSFKSRYIGDEDNLKTLSTKVKPFILRRTKEEVLKDLPPKLEETIHLEMGEKQKAFYNKLKDAFRLQITKELEEKGINKARFQVLDALLKLRQACLMPELVNMNGNTLKESIKLKYIEENIEDMITNGHNLLIFSQFTGFLSYVKEILKKKNINYNYLDGQTKREDRKKLVDSFNAGEVNVFIISLKAGGTGLNLTKADYVIHLDPWWNPAVENQATDRAHRIGQEKTVFVQKLIIKDSIEEKILSLQEKKKKLIDDVFSGNFSGSLTESDIKYIFE